MRLIILSVILCLFVPAIADAQTKQRGTYKYYDEDGNLVLTDTPPPNAAEMPKELLNEQGVAVEQLEGKKTEEQLAEEERLAKLEVQKDLQNQADRALLATYHSVEEIEMHRDRRVELFRAQARVTELFLRNLSRRLNQLKQEAGRYKPYSSDPAAEPIDPGLVEEIGETEVAIARHENNLKQFRDQEQNIIERFDGDIQRFKAIKGLPDDQQTRVAGSSMAQAVPE